MFLNGDTAARNHPNPLPVALASSLQKFVIEVAPETGEFGMLN